MKITNVVLNLLRNIELIHSVVQSSIWLLKLFVAKTGTTLVVSVQLNC